MTSKVTATAHCGKNKRLRVTVKHGDQVVDGAGRDLKDGETIELYAYDSRSIHCEEVEVPEETAPAEESKATATVGDEDDGGQD